MSANYALYVACEEWHLRIFQKGKLQGEEIFSSEAEAKLFANGIRWIASRTNPPVSGLELKIESVLKRAEELPPVPLDSEQVKQEKEKAKAEKKAVVRNTSEVMKEIEATRPKTLDSLFG